MSVVETGKAMLDIAQAAMLASREALSAHSALEDARTKADLIDWMATRVKPEKRREAEQVCAVAALRVGEARRRFRSALDEALDRSRAKP